MSAPPKRRMTFEEYEAFEAEAGRKHEFYRGEVFPLYRDGPEAMAGASYPHVLLTSNATRLLAGALDGCAVLPVDMKVRLEACALSVYPDVVVVCGTPQFTSESQTTLTNPTAIIEVLSPSTEAYDRGLKAECYRTLPSLQALVFIAQDRRRVEVLRREEEGASGVRWILEETTSGAIDVLGARLALDVLYACLDLPDHAPRP